MNKSLLLIICDFLLLSLLALARFDAPIEDETPEEEIEGEVATAESDLIEILKMSLQSERDIQESMEAELARREAALEDKQRTLSQTDADLEKARLAIRKEKERIQDLMEQRELLQQEKGSIAQDLLKLREDNVLERERLRQAQLKLDEQQERLEETLTKVDKIEEEKARLEEEKQMITTELKVAETRQVLYEQQLENSKLEIEFERQQRREAEMRAESLTEGVKVLAGTSEEIKEEIKQLQPKTPNALYTEYKRNKVTVHFDTSFPGIFQNREKSYETETILVSDSKGAYVILHCKQSPFDLTDVIPTYDSVRVTVKLGDRIITPRRLMFLRLDPRVIVIPVAREQIPEDAFKIYPLVLEPFRFPKAVVIDNERNYFGESSFKVHPRFSHALEMDKKIISQLFGEFSPSKGDLVMAQTGEFMGVMVNNDFAALVDHISASDTIWVGDTFDPERTSTIVSKLSNMVLRRQ
jgi:hypothetical protein